jgi:hypothetical protein
MTAPGRYAPAPIARLVWGSLYNLRMDSGRPSSPRLSRRKWAVLVAAAPVLAQTTTSVPPQGSPAPANASPSAKLSKASDDVKSNSQQLAAMEVPMSVEPCFSFRA